MSVSVTPCSVLRRLLMITAGCGPCNTPAPMVLAQFIVAAPLGAGLTATALALLDPAIIAALLVDGTRERRVLWETLTTARPLERVAVAAAFERGIA